MLGRKKFNSSGKEKDLVKQGAIHRSCNISIGKGLSIQVSAGGGGGGVL